MKRVVLKLKVTDDKGKQKDMKADVCFPAMDLTRINININMKEEKITVSGDVDPVNIESARRGTVGLAKESKQKEHKKEEAKKELKKEEVKKEEPTKKEPKKEEPKKKEPKKELKKEEPKKKEPKKEETKKKEPKKKELKKEEPNKCYA